MVPVALHSLLTLDETPNDTRNRKRKNGGNWWW